jgi:hypothetical protein
MLRLAINRRWCSGSSAFAARSNTINRVILGRSLRVLDCNLNGFHGADG